MASSLDFVQDICAQMENAGEIRYKMMFGEYGLYCDGKFFACICENELFIKITDAGKALMPNCKTAFPYEGSSTLYFLIADFDDRESLAKLVRATCDALPAPKPKKKKA